MPRFRSHFRSCFGNRYDKQDISALRVAERYVHEPIKRAGRIHMMRCPFHGDTDASFAIYEDHYHCFACSWHGDPVKFVKEITNCTWEEARERAVSA
jgi:DNA primase